MNESKFFKLKQVCKKIITGGTPLTSISEFYENGSIPWLKTKEVNFNRIHKTEYHITKAGLNNSSAKLIPRNSVIVAMYGQGDTAGRVAINKIPLATNQACCNLVLNEQLADYQFIYYYLMNSYEELVNRKTGSAQPNLNTKLIGDFEVLVPPLCEQKAIASVLNSLDDKIDLLHRQNKTLEEMAETLFRQYFVENVEDSWEEYRLSEIVQHRKENIVPDKNTLYTHYSIPSFDSGKRPISELGENINSNKYLVCSNSILISKLNPHFPRVWALYDQVEINSICSTEFQVVVPKKIEYFSFVYYFLKSKHVTDELITAASGTSGSHQRVQPKDIFNLTFSAPSIYFIEGFHFMVEANLKKIIFNLEQIQAIEKIRNILLPKLMSGEIRIKQEKL